LVNLSGICNNSVRILSHLRCITINTVLTIILNSTKLVVIIHVLSIASSCINWSNIRTHVWFEPFVGRRVVFPRRNPPGRFAGYGGPCRWWWSFLFFLFRLDPFPYPLDLSCILVTQLSHFINSELCGIGLRNFFWFSLSPLQ